MATKRMFDRSIMETDSFSDLPMTAKAVYFLLGMEADDEGFISPKRVLKLYGGTDDDIKILIVKNYLIPFESGVVVITDWKQNNWLDNRRIKETQHKKERKTLCVIDGKYTPLSTCLASAELEESSIEESSIEENSNKIVYSDSKKSKRSKKNKLNEEYENSFEIFWKEYPVKVAKGKAYDTWKLLNEEIKEICINAIKNQNQNKHFYKDWLKEDSAPHPTTWLNQKRWEDEVKIYKEIKIVNI